MRKGNSIVELLVVIAVLAAISVPIATLSKTLMYDIPRSTKFVEANTSILNVLKYMKQDINSATGFPQSASQYTADANCLLIQQKDKTICYLLHDTAISRLTLSANGEEKDFTSEIPKGKIKWRVWRKNDTGYAVEITKCIEVPTHSRIEKKMQNSYLYFAGAQKEAVN